MAFRSGVLVFIGLLVVVNSRLCHSRKIGANEEPSLESASHRPGRRLQGDDCSKYCTCSGRDDCVAEAKCEWQASRCVATNQTKTTCGASCNCPNQPICESVSTCKWSTNTCTAKTSPSSSSPSPTPVTAASPTTGCSGCGNGCCNCPNQPSCQNGQAKDSCQWVTSAGGTSGSCQAKAPTSTAPADSGIPQTCTTVPGMSVGSDAIEWWPFSLKQFANGTAESCMPIISPQAADRANATLGTYGAEVTVLQSDPVPWHIQLSSAPALLDATKLYTLKFTAKSSVPAAIQVAIVQVEDCMCNWQVFYIAHPKTSQQFQTYTMVNLLPPKTTQYLLNFDLARASAGTVFSFDDIMVCQQSAQVQATAGTTGTAVAAASESFESATANFIYQVASSSKADIDLRSSEAAYSGTYGAAIKIKKNGTQPWHIQLAGQAVAMNASNSYSVQLALKQIGAGAPSGNWIKVTWVQPDTYNAISVSAVQPTSSYKVFTLPPMSPPQDGQYYLTIDMGLLETGSTVYVDDIQVTAK